MTIREDIETMAEDAANEIDQTLRQRHTHKEVVIAVKHRILAGVKLVLERKEGISPEDVAKRGAEWDALNAIAEQFVADYEFDAAEDGYHNPTDQERILINDCIAGILADDSFMAAIARVYPIRRAMTAQLLKELET